MVEADAQDQRVTGCMEKFPLEDVEYVPPKVVDEEILRKFARFEVELSDICGDHPRKLITTEKPYRMTATDAFEGFDNWLKKGSSEEINEDWYNPICCDCPKLFGLGWCGEFYSLCTWEDSYSEPVA